MALIAFIVTLTSLPFIIAEKKKGKKGKKKKKKKKDKKNE